jgi:hypothetical protein
MRYVHATVASLIFLLMLAVEVQHDLVLRVPWPGYLTFADNVVWVMGPPWLLAAIGVWIRRPFARFIVVLAGLLAVAHGIGVRIGGSYVGVGFMLGGIAALTTAWYAAPGRVLGRLDDASDEVPRVRRRPDLAATGR